jgi:hypothetical protein
MALVKLIGACNIYEKYNYTRIIQMYEEWEKNVVKKYTHQALCEGW